MVIKETYFLYGLGMELPGTVGVEKKEKKYYSNNTRNDDNMVFIVREEKETI